MRILFFTAFLLSLAGCSASGPSFNETALPKGDGATVVVYRDGGPLGIAAAGYEIDFNGEFTCKLLPRSFFVNYQNKPQKTVISSTIFGEIGTSRIALNLKPDGVYYVRLDVNKQRVAASMALGMAGAAIDEASSENSGPFIFKLMPPEQAKQELTGLRQDCINFH